MTWRPVRGQLGIRAFGAAAFTAEQPGELVVEPHTESGDGRGHQELYFVARGHAEFTLGGQQLEAPEGTFVFVEDPAVHRSAVATQPGTAVLVFGGERAFTPAGEEYMARVRHLAASDPEGALRLAEQGLRELPESPGARYAMALATAAQGDDSRAREWLAQAVAEIPELVAEARGDPALARLLG
jgi:hypothetical protein